MTNLWPPCTSPGLRYICCVVLPAMTSVSLTSWTLVLGKSIFFVAEAVWKSVLCDAVAIVLVLVVLQEPSLQEVVAAAVADFVVVEVTRSSSEGFVSVVSAASITMGNLRSRTRAQKCWNWCIVNVNGEVVEPTIASRSLQNVQYIQNTREKRWEFP